MDETEFSIIAKWAVAIILVATALTVCPPLVSAASDASVIAGIGLFVLLVVNAALSIVGRYNKYYQKLYADIRDAFFN